MNLEWQRMSKAASVYRSSRAAESFGQPDLIPKQLSIFWLCWSALSLLENGLDVDAEATLRYLGDCLSGKSPLLPPDTAESLAMGSGGVVKGSSENPGLPGLAAALDGARPGKGLSGADPQGAADSQSDLEGVHGTQEDIVPGSSPVQGKGGARKGAPSSP